MKTIFEGFHFHCRMHPVVIIKYKKCLQIEIEKNSVINEIQLIEICNSQIFTKISK